MTLYGHHLLKDFLENDSNSNMNITNNQKSLFSKLSISRSSKAASTTASAIHRAFNAVKQFNYNSVKSFSKLAKGTCTDVSVEVSVVKVKVKDILPWRSLRDFVEDESRPSNFCDSYMQWGGTCSAEEDELSRKDAQQGSPISILNFHCLEEGEQLFPSHKCLAHLERRKNILMHNSQDFECLPMLECKKLDSREHIYLEKKHHEEGGFETKIDASKLLNQTEMDKIALNRLFFDFFHNELATSTNDDIFENNLRMAKAWMNWKYEGTCEREMKGNKVACVREMDKGGRWSKFDEEKQEIAVEVQIVVLDCLINEVIFDLVKENI